MSSPGILMSYQSRLVALQATASQLRLSQLIALTLASLAIAAVLLLAFLSFIKHRASWTSILLPVPVALYAGRLARKRNLNLLATLRLEIYCKQAIARLTGTWVGSGVNGDCYVPSGHAYAHDLNLFGKGSLFELLCTCRTEVGRRQLANDLLKPPILQESLRRQEAVKELQGRKELHEQVYLLGEYSFQESTWETIVDWLDSLVVPVHPLIRILSFCASASVAFLLFLGWEHLVSWSVFTICLSGPLLISTVIGLLYQSRVLAASPLVRSLARELKVLRQGLALLQVQSFQAPLLSELVNAACHGDPSTHLGKLERLSHALEERNKEWFYLPSRVLLVGTQVFFALENWRRNHAGALRHWLMVWGEFEALIALARYAQEHPDHSYPLFSETGTMLESEAMGHPLLPSDRCVRNSISLHQQTRFYIISGSNMAGKSTLLRAIGLNAVLAYAGAPVCASFMLLSRLQICASLAVQDSLLQGKSKFLAEIDRLKQALDKSLAQKPVLFLIDEMLSGTNSQDRRTAVEAILREFIRQGAIGALSTHDLALTELAKGDDLPGINMHMGSKTDSDPLDFDYRLKPGVVHQSSALAIARLAGVPV